jgi:hypothetical protein
MSTNYSTIFFEKKKVNFHIPNTFAPIEGINRAWGECMETMKHKHVSHIFVKDEKCYITCDELALNPVYYYEDDEIILYSQKIEQIINILLSLNICLKIDVKYVYYYLYGKIDYIACPDFTRTIYTQIKKTRGGEQRVIDSNLKTNTSYYGILHDEPIKRKKCHMININENY